jgi:iron(III) transport system substrate-binding protein
MKTPIWTAAVVSANAIGLIAGTIATSGDTVQAADKDVVNLYSYRQPFLINPLLDAFTEKTGIKVNIVYAKRGMLEKLKAEGANSPADAVLTVDIGRLTDLTDAGLLQPVRSPVLESNIPAHYRHPEGLWFGLTTRGRILFTSKDRVAPGAITSYEDLAKPEWKNRICVRSGKHVYNISLIASMIAHKGENAARSWLNGVKTNLARKPQGNDRAQAKAIYEGLCDVAIANTYYMAKMATNEKKPEQQKWAKAVTIVFPNRDSRGTHVNVSGAAITKSAPHRDNAVKLIEFLSGDFAQRIYASRNFEYPVKAGVPLDPVVDSWGTMRADTINLTDVARHRTAASRLVDETKFDLGSGGS